jgi:Protein of unknown function (DUF1761)
MEMNFLPLLLAALVPMAMGFVWYHEKVFGTTWMNGVGLTKEQVNTGNMAMIFGVSFVGACILAMGLAVIATHDSFIAGALYYEATSMNPDPTSESGKWLQYYKDNLAASNHTFKHGFFHGAMIGGVFISLPIVTTDALLERKGFKVIAIKAGYWVLTLGLMGGIIASMS